MPHPDGIIRRYESYRVLLGLELALDEELTNFGAVFADNRWIVLVFSVRRAAQRNEINRLRPSFFPIHEEEWPPAVFALKKENNGLNDKRVLSADAPWNAESIQSESFRVFHSPPR